MLIFAYGSNMCSARLHARVPSAVAVGVAMLPGHVLRFHKRSTDGSAKANAFRTDTSEDLLFGVVFDVSEDHKHDLDRHEGLGAGYSEQIVTVQIAGAPRQVYIADADAIADHLMPYTWYVRYVLAGAREHHLPRDHVAQIVGVSAVAHPDRNRHARNWIDLPDSVEDVPDRQPS